MVKRSGSDNRQRIAFVTPGKRKMRRTTNGKRIPSERIEVAATIMFRI